MFICPNCGAPVTEWRCEYCETVFPERKAEEDELNKLIREYSTDLEESNIMYAQLTARLKELVDDSHESFKYVDGVFNSITLFLIIFVVAAILPLFLH